MNTAKRTLLTAAIAAAAIAATAQGHVTFKGSVIPLDRPHHPTRMCLVVNGHWQDVPVRRNGNFKFTIRQGQRARIISGCEGFVPKEVLIDATHANQHRGDRRTVRFDVELERRDSADSLHHPHISGNLAFAAGTGRILVGYNDLLERAEPTLITAAP